MTSAAQKTISSGGSGGGGGSSGGAGGGLTSSGGGGDDLALNDMIVIYDYPENVAKAEAVIRDVDVRPRQVLVEATVMSVKLTEDMEFGIDWNLLSGIQVDTDRIVTGDGYGTPIQTVGFTGERGGPRVDRRLLCGQRPARLLTALEEITDTTVLANPKILAVNKQEGQVLIGNKIGYVNATTQNQTSTTQSVSFLETGTRLVFRPYICSDGYIRLDIYPKDSDGLLKANGHPG